MKGKCDSLHYSVVDSTIFFFDDPVLWSSGSQLTGEEIKVTLDSNEIDKMYKKTFFSSPEISIGVFIQLGKNKVKT